MLNKDEQKEILELQFSKDMYKQTNQACIDFAKQCVTGPFLLNGAAATALLASKNLELYFPATLFAVGALCAIVTGGLSYLFTLSLADSWRLTEPKDGEEPYIPHPFRFVRGESFVTYSKLEKLRLVPIGTVILSLILFGVGLWLTFWML